MDPDIVRIVLVVLGVLLVIGIYLWDRYKRGLPRQRRVRRHERSEPVEFDDDVPLDSENDPLLSDMVESIPEMRVEAPQPEPPLELEPDPQPPPASRVRVRGKPAAARDPDPEPQDLGDWSSAKPSKSSDPQGSLDLSFDAHGGDDYLHVDPALYDEVERKIVIINVVSRDVPFAGVAIAKACDINGLRLGEMSIYHRHDERTGKVLFSMASMVEPGSFPSDNVSGFETPGVSLFTQLPGARDGLRIYEEMLSTANRLATALQGELRDERHNKLTRQMEKHTRESIIEHQRKLKLARSRH